MPSDPNRDKGPTFKEFVLYWVFILASMSLLALTKDTLYGKLQG